MPNWCYTNLSVSGDKRTLAKFLKDITEPKTDESHHTTYSLNKLVPLDPRANKTMTSTQKNADGEEVTTTFGVFTSTDKDGFDGYAHAHAMWGTKWGACSVEIDDETIVNNTLNIRYESAWSPADMLILNISRQYPTLIFGTYSDEESRAFVCWSVFHNGEVIEEGGRDPQKLTPELHQIWEKTQEDDASEEAWDEWYEAESEWNNYLTDECCDEMTTVMTEYKKHLAHIKRCEKEGRTPPTFISSV